MDCLNFQGIKEHGIELKYGIIHRNVFKHKILQKYNKAKSEKRMPPWNLFIIFDSNTHSPEILIVLVSLSPFKKYIPVTQQPYCSPICHPNGSLKLSR